MKNFFLLVFFLTLITSCSEKQKSTVSDNETIVNQIKVEKLDENEIKQNALRDLTKLLDLIKKESPVRDFKNYLDSSLELYLTDEFGSEFTDNKEAIYNQMTAVSRQTSDSLNAISKYENRKTNIIFNKNKKIVAVLLGTWSFFDKQNNNLVFDNKVITLGISEDNGYNFKFVNVTDVETSKKILRYKFSNEEINSMKPFKKK